MSEAVLTQALGPADGTSLGWRVFYYLVIVPLLVFPQR
jgi:hypothetical protein